MHETLIHFGRWNRRFHRHVVPLFIALGLLADRPALAQDQQQLDLTQMKIEDLMNMKVTSVSKREESLARAAAAVFVITQEDIRRSGATNLPDVLRIAPGVDVQQINASTWAISIRGFNSRYSNKVLVLIDGRSVYANSFSGVFWEQIDLPLESIERIEVIRGPGATVWGANAMNGVISILTKSAKETRGGLATAASGSQLYGQGLIQKGGSIGRAGDYRVFGTGFDLGNSGGNAVPAFDHWGRGHVGGRIDWDVSNRDSLMVQSEGFFNEANQTRRSNSIPTPFDTFFNESTDAAGGDLLARWTHATTGGSQTSLQTYVDAYRRTDLGVPAVGRTFDLDFQDHIASEGRHNIVWGLGYRLYSSGMAPGYGVSFYPPTKQDSLFSGFMQDEIRLTDGLWFTIGGKTEHNPYTGLEFEPSARIAWNPLGTRHTIWASASKAVRQPSRTDTTTQTNVETIPVSPDVIQVLRLYGNMNTKDEEARDYELGYRSEITRSFSVDLATFLTFYHHLQSIEIQPMQIIPGTPLELLIPLQYDSKDHAVDYGGEVALNWSVKSRWRITPSYSYLHATLRQDPASQGPATYPLAIDFPQNLFQVRSQFNLSRKMQFDQALYYTARLPGGTIPGHTRLDLRWSRRLGETTELSVVGQNVLRPRTLEYGDSYSVLGTQSVRSVYAKISWRF